MGWETLDICGLRLHFVGFIFKVTQSSPTALPNSHLPKQNWADIGTTEHSQQNLVPDYHGQPVNRIKQMRSLRLAVSVGLKGSRLNSGAFSQNVNVALKLERDKFSRGVEWIHDLVFRVVFAQGIVQQSGLSSQFVFQCCN